MRKTAAHGVHHYENFPVASWLTPRHLRPAIQALYWFARVADDLADEGEASSSERLANLAAYRADLQACAASQADSGRWSGVFQPLCRQIRAHQLPVHLLLDLLDAFHQDVHNTQQARWYASMGELMDYARRSANPVGRLLLHLYAVKGETEMAASDAICSALQLINFWQDPSRDLPRGRNYFPLEDMQEFGVQKQDISSQVDTLETMSLIAHCTRHARNLMQTGQRLPIAVQRQVKGCNGWRLSMELRCVIHGGLRILDKIEALQYRTLSQRPQLSVWDVCVIVWRALWHRNR